MDKRTIVITGIFLLVVVFIVIAFTTTDDSIMSPVVEEKETKQDEEKTLKEIVYGFVGTPYELGPLGEKQGEEIYRTDVFDCTTLVLVSVSKLNSNKKSPQEMMEQVNYYPFGQVSYENRLHFSTYRNKVSPFFKDITLDVGKEKTQQKQVVLNKKNNEGERIIDIDWEKEITLNYIEKQDVPEISSNLPLEVGVAFIIDGDEEIGLDVRHEGFLFDRNNLIHSSNFEKEVVEVDFLNFIKESDYSGVVFFSIIKK